MEIEQYWKDLGCIKRCTKQQMVANNSRRKNNFKYILNGRENYVCKTFLLATLGLNTADDWLLKSVRDTEVTAASPKERLAWTPS